MRELLYIKFDKNVSVDTLRVKLSDVCKMECINKGIVSKAGDIELVRFPDKKHSRYVFSTLKVIEMINSKIQNVEVVNIGEPDFIIEYGKKKDNKFLQLIKAVLVSVTVFFGAGFAITTFNNDVSVKRVFNEIYKLFTGKVSDGFTIIEVMYSVGLFIGIVVFYNHLGKKKITNDPTPIEVEMRLYEDDINTTLIDGVERKESHIDVD